jgi:hypothetical protein
VHSRTKSEIASSATLEHGSSSSTTTNHFIHRDVQSLVVLRPPQAELIRAVAQMSRKRDPNAPKRSKDKQRQTLCHEPHLTNLRRQREALSREIRFGGKSLERARGTEMHRRHNELGKAISRRRQELRRKDSANWRRPLQSSSVPPSMPLSPPSSRAENVMQQEYKRQCAVVLQVHLHQRLQLKFFPYPQYTQQTTDQCALLS